MKKFINRPENIVAESIDGLLVAHSDILALGADRKFVRRRVLRPGKVAVVSGGGSGHEPLHTGFVGHGMLDAACPGPIFTSPTPEQIAAAAAAVDTGAGVVLIVKNYDGDVMNFEMATELMFGAVRSVRVDDDVSIADHARGSGRRGVAGTLVVERMVGAAAEQGRSLDELCALAERVTAATRSIGVALTSCVVPASAKPTFLIDDAEMEVGVGIHGEAGRQRTRMATADEIAHDLVEAIVADLGPRPRTPCLLFVNGFGGTPSIELYLIARAASLQLTARGLDPIRFLVGSYVTSLEMAGCSLTVSLLDDERLALWDSPIHTAALRWGM